MKKLLFLFALLPLLAQGQIIVTAVGTGVPSDAGDGGPGTAASVNYPGSVAVGKDGALYICDNANHKIRKLSPPFYGGIITTVAGNGTSGTSGDGGWAIDAELCCPTDVAADKFGNVYISGGSDNRIRKVSAATGVITTIAGTGVAGYNGDGIPATNAQLNQPMGVCVDDTGNVYIADANNYRYRKIDTAGTITTIAGTGISGYTPDGARADTSVVSGIGFPRLDRFGHLVICDNVRIRKIDENGRLVTLAGNGSVGHTGDGGPATLASLANEGIDVDTLNNIYLTSEGSYIRVVNSTDGIIHTIAGDGTWGYSGDWGDPKVSKFHNLQGVAIAPNGDIFIGDAGNDRVRMITTHVTHLPESEVEKGKFCIYPNPTHDVLFVEVNSRNTEKGTLTVLNEAGQRVAKESILSNTPNRIPVSWPPGHYVLIITMNNTTYTTKTEIR